MTNEQLMVLIDRQPAGTVTQHPDGRLSLTYTDRWRDDPGATPLSLSMPPAIATHHDRVVRAFLWGLLPDNERVIERWARDYQVSSGNPFALLCRVGEDCAGAAQFVTPDRAPALRADAGGIVPVTESDLADRLRTLRRDPTAWHAATTGQFSLAGAQAKTALHYDPVRGQWGDPWGAVPTTHILKPAVAGFDDHDLITRIDTLAAQTPTALAQVAATAPVQAIASGLPARLLDQLSGRVEQCRRALRE